MKVFILLMVLSMGHACQETQKKNNDGKEKEVSEGEFYQLKTYIFDTDAQVEETDNYLKEAYLPALKRMGIKNIGAFKPIPDPNDTLKRILLIIPFDGLSQFSKMEGKLALDTLYMERGKKYLQVMHDNPMFKRYESVLLTAFKDMPKMNVPKIEGPRSKRVYELRSYESPSDTYYRNKVDMFNAGGEIKLFDQLDFNAVFYGEVISGPKMPNLMYMTTFRDRQSRDDHWKEFVDSPEWKELSSMSKYDNNVSHADIYLLYPTEYSDY